MKENPAGTMITSDEVAKLLRIPLIAVGQIVFDRRLIMKSFDQFDRQDVERLAKECPQYVKSLR